MARALLAFGLLLLGGCQPPELDVQPPLLVFNSYPANGATVARTDLGEVAFTFSADLGEAERARENASRLISLADTEGPIAFVRPDRTNVAYDPDTFTLRILIDPEVRRALLADTHELTIRAGFPADDGRVLPTSYVIRFHVVD